MERIKCITFDKAAQDALPEDVKAQMRYDKAVARKTQFKCTDCLNVSYTLDSPEDGDEILAGFCVKCGHPIWWDKNK